MLHRQIYLLMWTFNVVYAGKIVYYMKMLENNNNIHKIIL